MNRRIKSGLKITDSDAFRENVINRSLQADVDESGGFFLAEQTFENVIVAEREVSIMRAICRVLPALEPGYEALEIPTQEAVLSDATWTGELAGTLVADSTAPFGNRVLRPKDLMKRVKVSRKLLRKKQADDFLIKAIADALGTPQERAFLRGSGVGEATGIIGHDDVAVTTTSTSGGIARDDLVKWIFSLDARYLTQRTKIVTTPGFIKSLLLLKDADGQPVLPQWRGRLSNIPVLFSDGMPAAADEDGNPIAGANAAVVGDFSWYWILDGDKIDLLKLAELYAETNEVAFQATQYTDGVPVVPSAFRVLKIKE